MKQFLLLFLGIFAFKAAALDLRYNHLGYREEDVKLAFLCSFNETDSVSYAMIPFYVVQEESGDTIFSGNVSDTTRNKGFGSFKQIRTLDFSSVTTPGRYRILVDTITSEVIAIGAKENYTEALEAAFDFYSSQRCGDSTSLMHAACHLNDSLGPVDGRGGWHDAGDYIKYMITISFNTMEMMVTADYALEYFPEGLIDTRGESGIPDILEEARVGLEWILNMTDRVDEDSLYYQVADETDHLYWRMPEADDTSEHFLPHRHFSEGWGSNLSGKCVAALASASRLWAPYDSAFASTCLDRAKELWRIREDHGWNQASNPTTFYHEEQNEDDLLIGGVELFMATQDSSYISQFVGHYSMNKGWYITWGKNSFLGLAQSYRAGLYPNYCLGKMKSALDTKLFRAQDHSFLNSGNLTWGSNAVYTGDAQMILMYTMLTGDSTYYEYAQHQLNYLFGANQWGVSFMVGVGNDYPNNAHSQLNNLVGMQRGGVVGGPAATYNWEDIFNTIPDSTEDRFYKYQGLESYFDILEDYYTNEVALDYTVATLFLLHYYVATSSETGVVTPRIPSLSQKSIRSAPIRLVGKQITIEGLTEETTFTLYSVNGRVLETFTLSAGTHQRQLLPHSGNNIVLLKGISATQRLHKRLYLK